jgi:hypothetical protein
MSDELDKLLEELKNSKNTDLPVPAKQPNIDITEDTVGEYVLKRAAALIETGMFSVEAVKNIVSQSYEPEDIESYATLIKAVNESIDTLNKINLQNKKTKSSKELKQMSIDAQKALGPSQHNVNNNILIATREEIMKSLIEPMLQEKDNKPDKIINVTPDSD